MEVHAVLQLEVTANCLRLNVFDMPLDTMSETQRGALIVMHASFPSHQLELLGKNIN